MVRPPEVTSSCAGSFGIPPEVFVEGGAGGEPVHVVFRCHGPDERAEAEERWRTLLPFRGSSIKGTVCGVNKTGTDAANKLVGTRGRDILCGLGGKDRLEGRGGGDFIFGGLGADGAFGGPGPTGLDLRDGVSGNDLAAGGDGRDTCLADAGDRRRSC